MEGADCAESPRGRDEIAQVERENAVSATTERERAVDLASVRATLVELQAQGKDDDVVQVVMSLLTQLCAANRELELRVQHLLRQTFGRKTERVDPRQIALLLAELAAQQPAAAAPAEDHGKTESAPVAVRAHQRRPGRNPLPEWLPREKAVLTPSPEDLVCSHCGSKKERIGSETNELLEWMPGRFKVIEQEREKYACESCQGEVVIGPVGDKPLDGGLPGPGLLAHVLVSKYRDHLPLNRQAAMFARAGVEIADSTLAGWVQQGAELLAPVADAIHEQAMNAHVVQCDDTLLRVLDKEHAGGSKRGHIWGLIGDKVWASFKYTPSWEGDRAQALVEGRKGWLQVDGYSGFDALFNAAGADIIEVGCMAHARRKYVEALESGDTRAAVPIAIFQRLYAVEAEATAGRLDPLARLKLRTERSVALMDELGEWVAKIHPQVTPKSPLGKAFTYSLNQWRQLKRFLEDGRVQIDNNGVERELRAVAVGRKNYLFAGSDAAAERAAVLYTVIGTAVLHGAEPMAYVRDLVEKIGGTYPAKQLRELLPDRWIQAHPDAQLGRPGVTPPA